MSIMQDLQIFGAFVPIARFFMSRGFKLRDMRCDQESLRIMIKADPSMKLRKLVEL